MPFNIEPVTLADLDKLALDNPTIQAGLMAYRYGSLSLEQALMLIVAALAYDVKAAKDELADCYAQHGVTEK